MVKQTINGTFRQTNLPNESEEYLSKREELRLAEIELRNQRERVAELRRKLPIGPVVQDYVFEEVASSLDSGDSPIRTVRLSQLFTGSNRSVVLYQFMYGKKQTKPCPMCTAWIDGFNGIAHHLAQSVDFAIVAAADLPALRGNQDSAISVFSRDNDGTIHHSYTGHPWLSSDIKERGIDELVPIWNILDLTRQGRGEFYTKIEYPQAA